MSADTHITVVQALKQGHQIASEIARVTGRSPAWVSARLCTLADAGVVFRSERVRSPVCGQMIILWALTNAERLPSRSGIPVNYEANHAVFVPPPRERSEGQSALAPRIVDHRYFGPLHLGEPEPGRSALDMKLSVLA